MTRRVEPNSSHPWAKTPFRGPAPFWRTWGRPSKDIDIFISYKSQDVELARRTADLLIASGLHVWFAEYAILLAGRSEFREAIKKGIRRSKYGVVFSNDRYAASEYCCLELGGLLSPGNCGADRILRVSLGDDEKTLEAFPQFPASPAIEFRDDLNEVLRAVERLTSMPIEQEPSVATEVVTFLSSLEDGNGYVLDLGGWDLVRRGGGVTPFGMEGPGCRRIKNGYETRWNLLVGPMAPGSRPSPERSESISERRFYELAIQFSEYFTSKHHAPCAGVHLFHLGGFGQLALTYWWARDSYWTRRYSVVLPYPQTGQSVEFAFTFAFFGPFREYCRQASDMDRIVRSLHWQRLEENRVAVSG